MLASIAAVALASPDLLGRQLTLAALKLSTRLLHSVRGLSGQEESHHRPTNAGFSLQIPGGAERAQEVEKMSDQYKLRRFIVCPDFAHAVASRLGHKTLVLECDPGPGVLTRTLLNAGTHVTAVESNSAFLPDLESLKQKLDGQLKVVHCDFFKLDPLNRAYMKPPVMYSERLLEHLNILTVPWTEDVPLKVIGILPQKQEWNQLWKLLYKLYDRSSIYKYGRTELNLFLSEKLYKILVATPGETRSYKALSVLWQTACDIQLLHMEPWSSFSTHAWQSGLSVPKSVRMQNNYLYLVRMTPWKNLFTDSLTTANSGMFIEVVKQSLAKSKTKLIARLNSWSCGNGKQLLRQLELPENITTESLYPEQFKYLFEAMVQSNEFDQSWLYDDSLENIITCS